MRNNMKMIGVVLCGGKSIRMGSDKGLICSEAGGKVWANIARDKFSCVSVPSFLSVNQSQIGNYHLHFKEQDLIVDNPDLKIQGPLLGLLSTYLKHPRQDLMVIACDMINLNDIILKKLQDLYNSTNAEVIVFKGERIEPLCGIYSSRGLNKIYNAYQKKSLTNNSMMHALEKVETFYVPMPEEWKRFFENFNTADDLN